MADRVTSNDKKADIRFSPFMRLSTAISLGSLATVGLGVYLLAGQVLKNLGHQTPHAYVLAILFFAPVILVLAEPRGMDSADSLFHFESGIYEAMRTKDGQRNWD